MHHQPWVQAQPDHSTTDQGQGFSWVHSDQPSGLHAATLSMSHTNATTMTLSSLDCPRNDITWGVENELSRMQVAVFPQAIAFASQVQTCGMVDLSAICASSQQQHPQQEQQQVPTNADIQPILETRVALQQTPTRVTLQQQWPSAAEDIRESIAGTREQGLQDQAGLRGETCAANTLAASHSAPFSSEEHQQAVGTWRLGVRHPREQPQPQQQQMMMQGGTLVCGEHRVGSGSTLNRHEFAASAADPGSMTPGQQRMTASLGSCPTPDAKQSPSYSEWHQLKQQQQARQQQARVRQRDHSPSMLRLQGAQQQQGCADRDGGGQLGQSGLPEERQVCCFSLDSGSLHSSVWSSLHCLLSCILLLR